MPGDAEHRGDSFGERLTAVEAALERVEFDSLPLRKLRDFLEDNMILDGKNSIMPGTVSGDLLVEDTTLINIISRNGGGAAGSEGVMNYPNLHESGLVIPTWFSAHGGNPSSTGNIGSFAWETYYFNRWIAPRSMTVDRATTLMLAANGLNANSNLCVALYNEAGTTRLANCVMKHINTDLGGGGGVFNLATWTLDATVTLTAGTTYTFVMGQDNSMTNGTEIWQGNSSHIVWNARILTYNGVTLPGTNAEQLRWQLHGDITYNTSPNGCPTDLTADLSNVGDGDPRPFMLWKS